MLKKMGILALAAMALVAVAAVEADAHYAIISGRLVYHSVFCDVLIKNVQNLENNPAQGVCTVVATKVDTECQSPVGKIVKGTASHPVAFDPVSGDLSQTQLEKVKGRAHFSEQIPGTDEPDLGLSDEEAGCNNLWTVTRALIREADLTLDVYSCGDDAVCDESDIVDENRASTAQYHCVLPKVYTLNNPPTNVTVDCSLELFQHLQ